MPMPITYSSLPQELWTQIAFQCDRKTLGNVALTCKGTRQLTQWMNPAVVVEALQMNRDRRVGAQIFKSLSISNPSKTDRHVILKALAREPSLFSELAVHLQTPQMRKIAFVVATLYGFEKDHQLCEELERGDDTLVLDSLKPIDWKHPGGRPWSFAEASPEHRKDRELVLASVLKDGRTLQDVDPELKKDFEVVLAAVQQDGLAIQYADPELQKNLTIALAAIRQDCLAYRFIVDPVIKRTREYQLEWAKGNSYTLFDDFPELRKDVDIGIAMVQYCGRNYRYLDPELQKNRVIALAAVTKDRSVLEFLSPSVREEISDEIAGLELEDEFAGLFEGYRIAGEVTAGCGQRAQEYIARANLAIGQFVKEHPEFRRKLPPRLVLLDEVRSEMDETRSEMITKAFQSITMRELIEFFRSRRT